MPKIAYLPLIAAAVITLGLLANKSAAVPVAPATNSPPDVTGTAVAERTPATIYRSPSCGCCGSYITYLEEKGYDVTTEFIKRDGQRLDRFSIPDDMASCHTLEIGGYVVEGHVPEEAIRKMLEEKPDIRGIALPEMPFGSPGMPGEKKEPFVIYRLEKDGTTSPFMTI